MPFALRRLVLVGFVAVVGCGDSLAPEEDALRNARRRWARSGPAEYTFDLMRSCECTPEMAGPVRIVVRQGTVLSRAYVSNDTPVPAQHVANFPSVDGLFDVIAGALRDAAWRVEVQYDEESGFPRVISIDYDRIVADDEFTYTVTALRAIN